VNNARSPRKIIHVDMDMFYAAIEVRDAPHLADKPLAVGGRPDVRGVVATANYVARKYGVHSAMPMSRAVRLCPELVIVPPRFEVYQRESRQIRAIFERFTSAIEPLSLDEAYLDVSNAEHFHGSATLIATAIRRAIRDETGLTASAGVAPNKFLAKVASDWRKPDGLTVIRPEDVAGFVGALPVRKIPGVGPKMGEKLTALGIETCADVRKYDEHQLESMFGRWGPRLHRLAGGIDERPVVTERIRKSVSVERTYAEDLPDLDACRRELEGLWRRFSQRYDQPGIRERVRGWTVKVRFDDFETTTVDRTPPMTDGQTAAEPSVAAFAELLDDAWSRGQRPVRLLGIGVRLEAPRATSRHTRQMELWPTGW